MTANAVQASAPTARDALFHAPPLGVPEWLETNWFSFQVPERNIRASIAVGFRTNVGSVMSHVTIWSKPTSSVLGADFRDARVHLPMPVGNLDDYTLLNGLHVRQTELGRSWELRFEGRGAAFELTVEGLMRPVSSKEMRTNLDGGDFSHFHAVDPVWSDHVGHIDQTMKVTGELRLHGETIPVSCVSNMDHSWGPRPERDHSQGNFDEGAFSDDFAFHVMTKNPDLKTGVVTNGYVLDHGEPFAIASGVGHYERDGWAISRLVYELEDVRGKSFTFEGEPLSNFPIPSWPNQYNIASLVRWRSDGVEGWGDYKWHWEVREMQARGGEEPA
jgi:hypothetical protein